MATVVCSNTGFEAADITASLEVGDEFSLPVATLSLEPNTEGELQIAHAPVSEGPKQDTLHILSGDPDSPDIAIPLTSAALVVEPCSAVLEPPSIDLGLVGIGDARRAFDIEGVNAEGA